MRTIPRNWRGCPIDDYRSRCDICGVSWPRSRLSRNQANMLCCHKCITGKDEVECARANMADAIAYNNEIAATAAKEPYGS